LSCSQKKTTSKPDKYRSLETVMRRDFKPRMKAQLHSADQCNIRQLILSCDLDRLYVVHDLSVMLARGRLLHLLRVCDT